MRRVFVISALTALLLMSAVPAFAQDYPPEAASCTMSPTVVDPGDTVAVDCEGWAPDSEVEVTVFSGHGEVLGSAETDDDGDLSVDVTLPSDLAPGDHTLRLSGTNAQGEEQDVDLAFTVRGAAAQPEPDRPDAAAGLPATGKDSVLFGVLALGLFTAGGGALYAARRRNAELTQS